jgi:hypothetical protein
MMKILVCGGRHVGRVPNDCPHTEINARIVRATSEQTRFQDFLRDLHASSQIEVLLHFNVRGAQRIAAQWANLAGIPVTNLGATNLKHPFRGVTVTPQLGAAKAQQILLSSKPDIVLQFPATPGDGAEEIVDCAKGLGIQVCLMNPDTM